MMVMCDIYLDVVLGNKVECTKCSHVGVKVAGGDWWKDERLQVVNNVVAMTVYSKLSRARQNGWIFRPSLPS